MAPAGGGRTAGIDDLLVARPAPARVTAEQRRTSEMDDGTGRSRMMETRSAPADTTLHARRRAAAILTIMALLAVLIPSWARAAAAADPTHVSFRLEGCKNDGSITLPIDGEFVCPTSAYTTGNLGAGWNDLDLVPFRLEADATKSAPGTQTYTVAIAVDFERNGIPGYDFLSEPVLNTDLSDPSCQDPVVGPQQVTADEESRYRLVTITQAADTTDRKSVV
jgi:hypothetical protein